MSSTDKCVTHVFFWKKKSFSHISSMFHSSSAFNWWSYGFSCCRWITIGAPISCLEIWQGGDAGARWCQAARQVGDGTGLSSLEQTSWQRQRQTDGGVDWGERERWRKKAKVTEQDASKKIPSLHLAGWWNSLPDVLLVLLAVLLTLVLMFSCGSKDWPASLPSYMIKTLTLTPLLLSSLNTPHPSQHQP